MTFRARRWGIVAVIAAATVFGLVVVPVVRHRRHAAHEAQGVYYCPMHPTYTADHPGDCPICSMKLVKRGAEAPQATAKKVLYWTDPMMPGYRSAKPGKSPMGMEMIPVYEEGGGVAGYAPVTVTPQRRQLIGLKTAAAQRRAMVKTIRTVGRIAYDPELYRAEAEYLETVRAFAKARGTSDRDVAAQAQQLVEASRLRLQLLGLSPAAIEEMAAWAGPDQRLLLADPHGGVWLYAPLYEFELPFVEVGQRVHVEAQAIPGIVLEGTVRAIDPVLDMATRTARARVALTDPQRVLRPGMFVNASLMVGLGERLTVPEEAVMSTGARSIVFVDRGQGVLEPREVTVGVTADGAVEILNGVAEGDRVVTSGNFLIDSESRLKGALQTMGEGAHPHGQ